MSTRRAVGLLVPVVWFFGMLASWQVGLWISVPIAATILVAAVLFTDGRRIGELLRPSRRVVVVSAVAVVWMVAATYALFPLLEALLPSVGTATDDIYSRFLSTRRAAVMALAVVPLIVAEEILFRGALQAAIHTRSRTVTVLLSALIYAAAQAPLGSALLVGVAFVCGAYWSALRLFSASLVPPLLAHLAWDVALIIVPLRG